MRRLQKTGHFFCAISFRVRLARELRSEVGSDVKCRYVGGHLLKRVTRIVRRQNYAFEVVEQNLALGGIRLLGGVYTLRMMAKDRTRVALATHYASPNCPRWLFGRLEAAVCHSFSPLHFVCDAEQSLIALKFHRAINDRRASSPVMADPCRGGGRMVL